MCKVSNLRQQREQVLKLWICDMFTLAGVGTKQAIRPSVDIGLGRGAPCAVAAMLAVTAATTTVFTCWTVAAAAVPPSAAAAAAAAAATASATAVSAMAAVVGALIF